MHSRGLKKAGETDEHLFAVLLGDDGPHRLHLPLGRCRRPRPSGSRPGGDDVPRVSRLLHGDPGSVEGTRGVTVLIPRFPKLKEWAYAGMLFDLTGAAASHLATGDPVVKILTPLLLLGIVMASWALRPEGRRLS